MKDRIRQLMVSMGMTQKTFAAELCIAEATLSGIFNGRTRPTNLTVNAIHERFPEVNMMWMMFGEGDMYTDAFSSGTLDSSPGTSSLPSSPEPHTGESDEPVKNEKQNAPLQEELLFRQDVQYTHQPQQSSCVSNVPVAPQIQYIEKYIDKPVRKITEIRIFFDDGTYETFTP